MVSLHPITLASSWVLALGVVSSAQAKGTADVRLLPDAETLGQPLTARAAQTRRVFVNFEGATLAHGSDEDATLDVTASTDIVGELAGFGGAAADRDAILQAVRADFEAYDVAITDLRPMAGDYAMTVVGPNRPTQPFYSDLLGTAFLDCWNAQSDTNISFAFHEAGDGSSNSSVARTISHEIGHGFGLEHTDDAAGLMAPSTAPGDASFEDRCIEVVPAPGIGIACTSQHEETCGSATKQNAHAELMLTLGPARLDLVGPDTAIMSPADGAEMADGEVFVVEAFADDNNAVGAVELYENGERRDTRTAPPYAWTVSDAPFGAVEYELRAVDRDGNETWSESVFVFVGVEQTPRFTNAQRTEGCGVQARGNGGEVSALALLLLCGLRRRQRSANTGL